MRELQVMSYDSHIRAIRKESERLADKFFIIYPYGRKYEDKMVEYFKANPPDPFKYDTEKKQLELLEQILLEVMYGGC